MKKRLNIMTCPECEDNKFFSMDDLVTGIINKICVKCGTIMLIDPTDSVLEESNNK